VRTLTKPDQTANEERDVAPSFHFFKAAVDNHIRTMTRSTKLFRTDVNKDEMWEHYLASFPEGSNPVFRERTEHDCSCCRQFIKAIGNVVDIVDGSLVSIWDVVSEHDREEMGEAYCAVADAMAAFVASHPIQNVLLHPEAKVGCDANYEDMDGTIVTWEHFYTELPSRFVVSSDTIGTMLGEARSTYDVFLRGLNEITVESLTTVLELIAQNSLYRGDEHKQSVEAFLRLKTGSASCDNLELFAWKHSQAEAPSTARLRNTSIGTLLLNLSKGMELDAAVTKFEAIVAPQNYKRPTALVTKAMITKAQEKVEELGFGTALARRHAVTEDITINNVLFADREARQAMNVFDEMASEVATSTRSLEKVEEVDIDTFLSSVLPNADTVELLVENRLAPNMMSLVAPVDPDSRTMLKWHNNFSWSYAGEAADSIKERVKRAGGDVTGDLRCSLSWYNHDDLDLHMTEPSGKHIYYGDKKSLTGGTLDVDMNVNTLSRTPVENITHPKKSRMKEGVYLLYVNNYTKRDAEDTGFEVEIEFDGVVHSFAYDKPVRDCEDVVVAKFQYSHADGIKIVESLPSSQVTKDVWGVTSQSFRKVLMVMLSPNYWDDRATGNKHYFFILDGCKNDTPTRGFFNEFLSDDLRDHRKVFELLGAKMRVEPSDNQLSGLGFSSTKRNSVFCKVTGSFTRTIKVTF